MPARRSRHAGIFAGEAGTWPHSLVSQGRPSFSRALNCFSALWYRTSASEPHRALKRLACCRDGGMGNETVPSWSLASKCWWPRPPAVWVSTEMVH